MPVTRPEGPGTELKGDEVRDVHDQQGLSRCVRGMWLF